MENPLCQEAPAAEAAAQKAVWKLTRLPKILPWQETYLGVDVGETAVCEKCIENFYSTYTKHLLMRICHVEFEYEEKNVLTIEYFVQLWMQMLRISRDDYFDESIYFN